MITALRQNKLTINTRFLKRSVASFMSLAAVLGSGTLAHAQDSQPFSFGAMLAPGGVQLPLGITAQATVVTTGTGVPGVNHGDSGINNPGLGGQFNGNGFDPAREVGATNLATRINANNLTRIDRGLTRNFADAIGFRVTFTSNGAPVAIPADYFYALDIDVGSEWKTAFAFNNNTFVAPLITLNSNTDLEVNTETVASSTWEAGIGLSAGQNIPTTVQTVATASAGGADPDDADHQAIFDFGGQSVTEITFLFGLETVSTNTSGNQNSGLSALFLNVPEFDVGKGASAAALQPDGTVNVTYIVDVQNSGAVDFTNVAVEDALTFPANIVSPPSIVTPASDASSTGITANTAWTGVAPNTALLTSNPNALATGDSFEIEFTVNVAADELQVSNSAQTTGNPVGFSGVFADDGSDTDTDPNGNPDTTPNVPGGPGVPTIINLPVPNPSISVGKVADSQGPHNVGDVVTYTYTVTNDGDVNIEDVVLADSHNGSDPAPTPGNETLLTDTGTQGDSTDAVVDGSWDILAPGDILTFTGTYTVTAADVDAL